MKMQEETKLSQTEQEQSEIALLVDRGMEFKVGKKSFIIHQPFYGTLDHLANVFIQMPVDLEAIENAGAVVVKQYAAKYSKLCAEAVAIAVLRTKWKIRLFKRPMTLFFYWNLTPSVMHELARRLNVMLNMEDFIHSIVLMSAMRTTMPEAIEAKQKA